MMSHERSFSSVQTFHTHTRTHTHTQFIEFNLQITYTQGSMHRHIIGVTSLQSFEFPQKKSVTSGWRPCGFRPPSHSVVDFFGAQPSAFSTSASTCVGAKLCGAHDL